MLPHLYTFFYLFQESNGFSQDYITHNKLRFIAQLQFKSKKRHDEAAFEVKKFHFANIENFISNLAKLRAFCDSG